MKTIRYTTKFRKDFKKYARNPDKVRKIREITQLLQNENEIPSKYRPHPLIETMRDTWSYTLKATFS